MARDRDGGEMTTRRNLLVMLGAAAGAPRALFAQAKKPPVVIGWLHGTGTNKASLTAFKEGLAALHHTEGASYVIEARWAEGRLGQLPALADELKQKKPAVIVTYLDVATQAAAKAAPGTPIVQAVGASPVDAGLARSLARPGGMVTGLTNLPGELSSKYLELLIAAAPKLKRVGFLIDSTARHARAHQETARRALEHYRVEGRFAEVGKPEDLRLALAQLAKEEVQGLVLMPSNWLAVEGAHIAKLALANRWPVVAGPQSFAVAGALLTYNSDALALCRRAAYYVDRILKGAKPGDLPIEQPLNFLLTVNLKTAKALGLTMPPEIMVRATRVIE